MQSALDSLSRVNVGHCEDAMRRTKGCLSLPSLSFVQSWQTKEIDKWIKRPLDNIRETSPLRVGVEQEVLAVGDPVSGSGAAEPCSIEGGDAERLMVKLTAARDRWAKVSDALPIVTLCYEVRYDAFWLVVAKLCAHRSTNSRCLPAPMVPPADSID
jgi:hypothetical protein